MKKIFTTVITMCLTLGTVLPAMAIETLPTTSTVVVNRKNVQFDAYNVDGNNYFKLRDMAYVLSGTKKQFDVGYDSNANAITLTSGKAYTVVGGEMEQQTSDSLETVATNSKIIKDGVEIEMQAYNINGNNYFKLRDLGEKFNFGVDYDESTNSVTVSTDKGYDDEIPKSDNRPRTDDGYLIPDVYTPPTPNPKPGSFTSVK